MNYNHMRVTPIDPESRLPSGADIVSNVAYDFGSSRPSRILKSSPSHRGAIDVHATARSNMSTIDGKQDRDLRGSWNQEERDAGEDARVVRKRREDASGRKKSTSKERPRRIGDAHDYRDVRETVGRSADVYHLSNLDIGAGHAGDSMTTFAPYATPLTHPYLPAAAVAAHMLDANTSPYGQPIAPAMFNASIDALRSSAAAFNSGSNPQLQMTRTERLQAEREREKSGSREIMAQRGIDAYLGRNDALTAQHRARIDAEQIAVHDASIDEAKRDVYVHQRQAAPSISPSSSPSSLYDLPPSRAPTREQRESRDREKRAHEDRERTLEASLHHMKDSAAQQATLDKLRKRDEIDVSSSAPSSSLSALHPLDATRKSAQVASLHAALASGQVLTRDFRDTLSELAQGHAANLRNVEQLYYEQKLTHELGAEVARKAERQKRAMQGAIDDEEQDSEEEEAYAQQRSQQNRVADREQRHNQQHRPRHDNQRDSQHQPSRSNDSRARGERSPRWQSVSDDSNNDGDEDDHKHAIHHRPRSAAPRNDDYDRRAPQRAQSRSRSRSRSPLRASTPPSASSSRSRSNSRSNSRPRSASATRDRNIALDVHHHSPALAPSIPSAAARPRTPVLFAPSSSNPHNARAKADFRAASTPINQAHAFGHGKLMVDDEKRPRTSGTARERNERERERSKSRTRKDKTKDGNTDAASDDASASDLDPSSSAPARALRLTEPAPFILGPNGGAASLANPSRTKQRFLDYLAEVQLRDADLSESIKAVPLPLSTLEPRYELMLSNSKQRSRTARRERKALTQSMMQPFEFAASSAIAARKQARELKLQIQQNGGIALDPESESDLSDADAPQTLRERRHRQKLKDPSSNKKKKRGEFAPDDDSSANELALGVGVGGVGGSANDDSASGSDSSSAASAASYAVAFGLSTRAAGSRSAFATASGSNSTAAQRLASGGVGANPHAREFKAQKIPWTSQVNMLDAIIRERERRREERLKVRAANMMASSALPSRMAADAILKEREELKMYEGEETIAEQRMKKKMGPIPTYHPVTNSSVPDFDNLHHEFAANLDRVKRSKKLTRPAPFDLTRARVYEAGPDSPSRLFKATPAPARSEPDEKPLTTKKTLDAQKATAAVLKSKRDAQHNKEREDAERAKPNMEMKAKLIPKLGVDAIKSGQLTVADRIREQTKSAKRDIAAADAQWASKVSDMKSRVRTRPLLVESYNSTAGRIDARRRALTAIKDSLDKAGIQDYSKHFDAAELQDLDLHF